MAILPTGADRAGKDRPSRVALAPSRVTRRRRALDGDLARFNDGSLGGWQLLRGAIARARCGAELARSVPGAKGLPAGPSKASPCGPGGSGVGLCLPGRRDDLPGPDTPSPREGRGCGGSAPRHGRTVLQTFGGNAVTCANVKASSDDGHAESVLGAGTP